MSANNFTQATGYYLNVYGLDYDVFVIFNESNDIPTVEEISIIGAIVEQAIDEGIIENDALGAFRSKLVSRIEETNLNCVRMGVQVILSL